jgi:hypothetical protein
MVGRIIPGDESMNQQDLRSLAAYIADYVNEEIDRENTPIDSFTLLMLS